MRRTISTVALLVASCLAAPHLGCHQQQAAGASQPSKPEYIAFASSLAALEVLDALHAQRMAANLHPTSEQFAQAKEHSAKLHRLRDALVVVRRWLSGEDPAERGRAAFRDAAELLQLLVDELRSQGVAVPSAVDAGLAAARLFG